VDVNAQDCGLRGRGRQGHPTHERAGDGSDGENLLQHWNLHFKERRQCRSRPYNGDPQESSRNFRNNSSPEVPRRLNDQIPLQGSRFSP
jgi:hypothetical protein